MVTIAIPIINQEELIQINCCYPQRFPGFVIAISNNNSSTAITVVSSLQSSHSSDQVLKT